MRETRIPFRTFERDGRLIYSMVRDDMTDLSISEAEGELIHRYDDAGRHSFAIEEFAQKTGIA